MAEKTPNVRSIRLIPASYGVEKLNHQEGELFYDKHAATLRVMDGVSKGGFSIATENFVNAELTSLEEDLQGQIDDAVAAIPEVDLTPYYTKTETDVLLQNVSVDLTGYATETFVNNKIAAIPSVDLTGYATESYVSGQISSLVDSAPETLDTLNELAAALGDDPNFATSVSNQIGLKANTADLGTAAFTDSTAYATAFQGSLADTALQPLDNVSQLVNDAGYLVSSNLTGLASETYVDTAITNLIDGAPESLDTLNELAAALNDNANIGSEVLAAISLKANTADLGAAAFTNNYNDLNNAEDWSLYSEKTSGTFVAADPIADGQALVLNLDNTVTTVSQTQSYVFDTFTTYNTISGLSIPGGRNFSPVSDSYGSLRNGPQTHQYARLGNTHFAVANWGNDFYLTAFTEDASGNITHLRSDTFENSVAVNAAGVIPVTIVADTDNNQLIILGINSNIGQGMVWRIVTWNGTDNLFSSVATGRVDVTINGQLVGNNECQKISAYYDETHSKIMVAFDYGIRAYFATYTASTVSLTQSSSISTPTSALGAGILFQPYELLTPMPTTGNYLVTWGYNTTSMVSVVIDSSGNPSWGTTVALDNGVQDVMVNTDISRIAVLSQPSVISGNTPNVYMYTFFADGSFSNRETAVNVDDGVASAFNNTSRGHFCSVTKKYLVYNFFNNGSSNRQRPAYSSDGKIWTYGTNLQAGDSRIVDGHYSGDVAVHQLLYVGGQSLRSNKYTTTTGPIVTNLTQQNLVGVASGTYTASNTVKFFGLGDTTDNLSGLTPGAIYYVSADGTITNDSSLAVATLGRAIDNDSLHITLGGSGGASVTVSDNPPDLASDGDLWWESDTGRLKVYYVDADTAQWVDASPPISQPNTPYIVGAVKGATAHGAGFSSVENSTGNYTITFNTPLTNTNYSIITTAEDILARFVFVQNRTTSSFDLLVQTETGSSSGARANFAVYNIG